MNDSIVVTGIGVVCSIGTNVRECFSSLKNERAGIEPIQYLNTVHKERFKLGEVKRSNEELVAMLGLSHNDADKYSRTALLAMLAGREAMQMAEASNGAMRTGVVSSTTVGGMDVTEQKYLKQADHSYLQTHPCGDSTRQLAHFIGATGYYTTLNTACSSGTNALIHGVRLLRHGIVDRVVVGGVDALTMFTLNGFNSLMILDTEHCKPFDKNRKGLNLAEGAGYLVLEKEQDANHFLCKVPGFANANDAYHQTASSPEGNGAFSSMSQALEMSGLSTDDIDYVNVHGTGTNNNDLSEGVALNRLFGKGKVPQFSSTKAYTGHTLAAAAGIEAVFSVLAIQNDIIYPNLNFEEAIEDLELIPNTKVLEGKGVNNVMSNSFGFGGNNSTVIFSK
ncbi:beta-ketoacyl-[acyl-carrier-protein] synthase family protein [Carboxylicivirga sp. A043]|uniref:beta-ketoacyl-[acyl-carrier-protein] synthase family protein n=1 Tax=Carboxylicivirga litoralis TaxID=2816963 RepID=UPI0021CB2726|nr:beta-ketoacyl-[acyl-carrier-protein] synthase family protein [Carboxylicivirga sp. A043]MCU4154370.1 beta-ketoacyl-[acyl-carrier-protein] synthase family protein [Carboxylicivirga sp. A043]